METYEMLATVRVVVEARSYDEAREIVQAQLEDVAMDVKINN
jgi:hypothetical protein